jgi:alpha-D-xyloside xylohydrolase
MASATDLAPTTMNAMTVLSWEEIAPGVWSGQVGAREDLTFRELAGAPPRTEALAKVGATAFPFEGDVRGEVRGNRVSVRLPLEADEQVWGLGLQFDGINRRGSVWHLQVDHYGDVPGRTHAPVPFYVSSAGYGVLFNTPRRISVYPGIGNRKDSDLPPIRDRNTDPAWAARPASDAVEATVAGPGMEVIVFAGPTPLDAVRRYNLYFGGGALPPRWGLGFWHRVPTRATAGEVTAEVEAFAARDFPLDVIGLEPGWQTKSYPCTFDWDETRFPDPAGFVSEMSGRGLRVNLWENPYVSPASSIYEAMTPFTGSHTVWLGEVPDYTLDAAREVLTDHHRRTHVDLGVSGYKIDEVDGVDAWLWPDHATFPSGHSGTVMRQTYGLQLQQTLTAMYRARNERTYGLVRGSNGGASAYPWVIYSDYYAHKGYVSALCNSGFAGVLWVPEIRSAGGERDWVRRMQTVCFSPMAMLNAWASGTKPWSFEDVDGIIRDTMKWRLRLLPYLYTAFARYHAEGTPPFRAMALEPGFVHAAKTMGGELDGEKNPYAERTRKDVDTQYMMGDDLLVAPLIGLDRKREVVLPQGKWYDFYTGELAGEAEVIDVSPELERIPVFVRDGGIVPLMEAANNTFAWRDGVSLEIRHYGAAPGTGWLYDDDGETYDYEQGAVAWYRLEVARDGDGKLAGTMTVERGEFPRTFGEVTWRFMGE